MTRGGGPWCRPFPFLIKEAAITQDCSRRTLLTAAAILPWATTAACAQQAGSSRSIVAYFTRSGNTRVIAGTIHRALGTALFEIRPARAYPEDYEDNVRQAHEETVRGYEPPLASRIEDMASYDTLYLGSPVWGMTAPPPIRSFLRAHDLRGKTVRPFITHGGYGTGRSMEVIRSHAPGATVSDPFVMEADQERRTMEQVRGWLDGL